MQKANKIKSISELGRSFSDTTIQMHEAIARKVGLSGTDHKYLGFLIKHGAMTAGELAKFTNLTTGATTGLIDRFEQKELIRREFDKEDRRKILIVPVYENITKLLGSVFSDMQTRMTEFILQLPDAEIIIIEKYLLGAIEIMENVTNKLQKSGAE